MRYQNRGVEVSDNLKRANVKSSDVHIEMDVPHQSKLELSRDEFENLVKNAPEHWMEEL